MVIIFTNIAYSLNTLYYNIICIVVLTIINRKVIEVTTSLIIEKYNYKKKVFIGIYSVSYTRFNVCLLISHYTHYSVLLIIIIFLFIHIITVKLNNN